jgi:G3E family GTPase
MGLRERIVAGGQLRAADLVVLNKLDLVDAPTRARVEEKIRKIVPKARILSTTHGRVPLAVMMGGFDGPAGSRDSDLHVHVAEAGTPDPSAHLDFETFHWRGERPLSSRRLRTLVNRLEAGIYRAKGVVALHQHPRERAVLHVVGRRAELRKDAPWGDDEPQTDLVFLGRKGSIDPRALSELLRACEYDSEAGAVLDGPLEGVLRWVRSLWQSSAPTSTVS